jgi:hypothetical protein
MSNSFIRNLDIFFSLILTVLIIYFLNINYLFENLDISNYLTIYSIFFGICTFLYLEFKKSPLDFFNFLESKKTGNSNLKKVFEYHYYFNFISFIIFIFVIIILSIFNFFGIILFIMIYSLFSLFLLILFHFTRYQDLLSKFKK